MKTRLISQGTFEQYRGIGVRGQSNCDLTTIKGDDGYGVSIVQYRGVEPLIALRDALNVRIAIKEYTNGRTHHPGTGLSIHA